MAPAAAWRLVFFSTLCAVVVSQGNYTSFAVQGPRSLSWDYAPGLGFLSIAALATIMLSVFVWTPVERTCCKQRTMHAPAVTALLPVLSSLTKLMFFAAIALWWAAALMIAAPVVPWLNFSITFTSGYETHLSTSSYIEVASLMFFTDCLPSRYCNSFSMLELISESKNIYHRPQWEGSYFSGFIAVGSLTYVVLIALVLPAAIFSTVAAYRLSKTARYGTPLAPFTGGASCVNLRLTFMLVVASAVLTAVLFAAAQSLATMYALSRDPHFYTSFDTIWTAQPGSFALGFSVLALFIACVLLSVASTRAAAAKLPQYGEGYSCCAPAPASPSLDEGSPAVAAAPHHPNALLCAKCGVPGAAGSLYCVACGARHVGAGGAEGEPLPPEPAAAKFAYPASFTSGV